MQYTFFRHWSGEYLYFNTQEELINQVVPQLIEYYLRERMELWTSDIEGQDFSGYHVSFSDGTHSVYKTFQDVQENWLTIITDMCVVQLYYAGAMCFEYVNDEGRETFTPCITEFNDTFFSLWFDNFNLTEEYLNSVALIRITSPQITKITPVEALP